MTTNINLRNLSNQTLGASTVTKAVFNEMFDRIYSGLGRTVATTAQTNGSVTEPASAATGAATEAATAKTAPASKQTRAATDTATAQTAPASKQTRAATDTATAQTDGSFTKPVSKIGDKTAKNSATATGGTVGGISQTANETATKQSQATYDNLPRGEIGLSDSATVIADATQQGCQHLDWQAISGAIEKGAQNAAELYDEGTKKGCCPDVVSTISSYEVIQVEGESGNRRQS